MLGFDKSMTGISSSLVMVIFPLFTTSPPSALMVTLPSGDVMDILINQACKTSLPPPQRTLSDVFMKLLTADKKRKMAWLCRYDSTRSRLAK